MVLVDYILQGKVGIVAVDVGFLPNLFQTVFVCVPIQLCLANRTLLSDEEERESVWSTLL